MDIKQKPTNIIHTCTLCYDKVQNTIDLLNNKYNDLKSKYVAQIEHANDIKKKNEMLKQIYEIRGVEKKILKNKLSRVYKYNLFMGIALFFCIVSYVMKLCY